MAKTTAAPKPSTGFAGFSPKATEFLEILAANNNRAWFLEHKATYEAEIRAPMGALVEALAFAFAAHDIPLTGDAKRSLFRINRDVRFAADKSPYKTNAGAILSRDGSKTGKGILYIQIGGIDGAFMAMGFYGPEPEALATLRHAIADAPDRWLKLEAALRKNGLALSRDDALVRMPKGFEEFAASPAANSLKLRNFVVRRRANTAHFFKPDMIEEIVEFAKAGLPLLEFGWRALK